MRRVPKWFAHRGDAYAKDGAALPLALQREADAAILGTTTAIVSALHHAGAPLLAGTDVWDPLLVPGYSLHKELERLVNAGPTPWRRSARQRSMRPASWM